MPRTSAPAGSRSPTHTPACSRSTEGSQTVGGTPDSASKPLLSKATPAPAVVSRPVQIVRVQPFAGAPPSGPVPSHHRTAPSPSRAVDAFTDAQSGAVTTAPVLRT